jgi:cell wall-associated NlpC family hydrolase
VVSTDNLKAAALSETYDLESYKLAQARLRIAAADRRIATADRRLSVEGAHLRQAAIRAYISGELTQVATGPITVNESEAEMANVYAGVALSQLRQAVGFYRATSSAVGASRAIALQSSRQIARTLAHIAVVRAQAQRLVRRAASGYMSISRRLLHLVGPKEFTRLFSPLPDGGAYRGPNLAGTDVSRVATRAQGLKAAETARLFLGAAYVFGGAGMTGVDCSGLTMRAWAAVGYSLAHSATLQWEESRPVPLGDLEPGDLLFYHFAHDGKNAISHVVMYVGSGPFGPATVIQAAEPGTDVALDRIYYSGLVSAGRP